MRLLITGSQGQLGNCLHALLDERSDISPLYTDVAELDLTDPIAVEKATEAFKPDYIINCAAYTAVDKAEADENTAYKVNAQAVENLAKAALKTHARIVHISTDYVFAGDKTTALSEDEPTAPTTAYGRTKLAGEKILTGLLPHDSIILRTAWLYSPFGNNFVKTMLRLSAERDEIKVVADQIGTPTSAFTLARAIIAAITAPKWKSGIYHLTDEGIASWYDFTCEILKQAGRTRCRVTPIPSSEYPTPASRPAYSLLSKEKFCKSFGFSLPHWREALAPVVSRLTSQ